MALPLLSLTSSTPASSKAKEGGSLCNASTGEGAVSGKGRKKPRLTAGQVSSLVSVPHMGIDEAGRGCLAGPVVAAVVLFSENFQPEACFPGLADSKKMPEAKRGALAPCIQRRCAWGVGLAWPQEIDALDIVNANFRAMCRALIMLVRALSGHLSFDRAFASGLPALYVDGNLVIRPDAWKSCVHTRPQHWHTPFFPDFGWGRVQSRKTLASVTGLSGLPEAFPFLQQAVIGGDALIPAISAASVLAKTRRDAIMTGLDRKFAGYGFARHKGYGTEEHRVALQTLGPCPLHRKTFLKGILPAAQELSLF